MCAAVNALLAGRLWFPQVSLERFAILSSKLRKWGSDGVLSPREAEVIGLLQRRLSDKEIGVALGITERTVRFHLHNIFGKLGVHERYSVVEWARAAPRATRKEAALGSGPPVRAFSR